ncbi:hypothetical protein C2845_PM13G20450 [Panicum miliaceum]|uniref:Uncharacterized protein n=1 Tax=Panicum miliaceum TaxID=4540 RepID=A0A3L6RHP6_PANMI|nr:hypothetical protein C2845_PM13G20450 [Panicum miliaceum]
MEVEAAADERGKKGAPGGGGGGGGLEWELERQYDFEREMMLMAAAAPGAGPQRRRRQRPFTADLLQNCGLPPPAKLFGPVPTLQRRATPPSAAGITTACNGELAALLVRDSVALSAHRRWVMMLEAENSLLRGGGGARPRGGEPDPDPDDARRGGGGGVAAWWVALAVCVGIAGVGLALGRLLC